MATESPRSETQVERADEVEMQPDSHWRRTLWTVWFAQLLSAIGFSFVMPFLPFFVRELGVSEESMVSFWAGLAMFAAGISLAIFQPIWGSLADRYGRKPMLTRAMFGGAITIGIIGLSQSVWQLVIFRLIQGAMTGTGAACNTLVASVTPRKQLGFAMGVLQTSVILGNAVGPWLGGMAADSYGYRIPFYICGMLWVIAGFVVLFGVKETFVPPSECVSGNHGLRQVFGGRGMIALLASFFLSAFAVTFVGPIFPLFVEKIAQTTRAATVTGQLMGAGGLAAGIACIVIGRLADRIGHRRVLIVSNFGSALFSIPHAFVQTVGQLFGLRVGWGLVSGGSRPAMTAMIGANVSSDMFGRSFGITTAAMCLGFALGPLAGGALASVMGLRWPFVVMGVLQLLCAVLIGFYVKPKAREERSEEPIAAE